MPGELQHFQRHMKMPRAAQVAKYSLREKKLPRDAWVSLGPNPFFLMKRVDRALYFMSDEIG
jgi:hypothetical protein